MAYEVTKVVRGHSYRYQVQSYRDEAGKVRNRWTYLGRVDGTTTRPPARRSTSATRERLLGALGRLLEHQDFEAIGAGAIAQEAGLAHGTFYRYFRHKRAALEAALGRVNEAMAHAREALRAPIGTLASERDRLREMIAASLAPPVEQAGVVRAWFALMVKSPELTAQRLERRRAALADVSDYLRRLRQAGLTDISNPDEVAAGVAAAINGAIHLRVDAGVAVSDEVRGGIVAIVERAVFPQGIRTAPQG